MTTLYIILACAGISFTITYTGIFQGFRDMVSKIHPKAEQFIHCPWCVVHWIVFMAIPFYPEVIIHGSGLFVLDYIVSGFAIIASCAPLHYIMLRAYKPVRKSMLQRKDFFYDEKEISEIPSKFADALKTLNDAIDEQTRRNK